MLNITKLFAFVQTPIKVIDFLLFLCYHKREAEGLSKMKGGFFP